MALFQLVCSNSDFSGRSRQAYGIIAAGQCDLTVDPEISTEGWYRVNQTYVQTGNPVGGIKRWATAAVFAKDSPGESETLRVDSNVDTNFGSNDCGAGPP